MPCWPGVLVGVSFRGHLRTSSVRTRLSVLCPLLVQRPTRENNAHASLDASNGTDAFDDEDDNDDDDDDDDAEPKCWIVHPLVGSVKLIL